MYSSRTATPKPASASTPSNPTKPVSTASVTLTRIGWSDIGNPTRRMSTNSRRSKRTPRNAKVTAVRPDASHEKSALADAANDVTVAMPAPATPSGGTGPAEHEDRHQRDVQELGGDVDDRNHPGLPRAAHHAGQRAEHPIGERAGEDRI